MYFIGELLNCTNLPNFDYKNHLVQEILHLYKYQEKQICL